jgi:C4-dicarboxylate-binding protein DctP
MRNMRALCRYTVVTPVGTTRAASTRALVMKAMAFKAIAVAATLFGIVGGSPTFAAEYTFRFAHVLMEDTPNAKAAAWFAKEVGEKSGGRIEVKVLPAGQLGGDVEIIEQIQANVVQIGIPPTATLGNFEPRLQILDLPYILPSNEMMIKVLDGPVGRKILDLLDKQGMYGVNFWGAGFRHMTNSKRKIEAAVDLKGIKMRTMQSPVILGQYREWGASPTPMAFGEVYNGLQQGVVDGQENPLANIGAMRFYEVRGSRGRWLVSADHASTHHYGPLTYLDPRGSNSTRQSERRCLVCYSCRSRGIR